MTKLTIMRGISGSGKSTWAGSQFGVTVVSRDNLRVALFGSDGVDYYQAPNLRAREDLITEVEYAAIRAGLAAGSHVISDNTNIEPKYMKSIVKLAHEAGADVEVQVVDITLNEALTRNAERALGGGRNVPDSTIKKQFERFKQTRNWVPPLRPALSEPYNGTPGKPKAFMVDLDGTLAHMVDRGPFDWARVGEDDVDVVVADLVNVLASTNFALDMGHYKVVVMSGRDAVCRGETIEWLENAGIQWDHLIMRPERDMRPDNLVKAELFDTYVRDNFDVQFVIDDRWQVAKMWLQMGLKVLNVSGLDRGEF